MLLLDGLNTILIGVYGVAINTFRTDVWFKAAFTEGSVVTVSLADSFGYEVETFSVATTSSQRDALSTVLNVTKRLTGTVH